MTFIERAEFFEKEMNPNIYAGAVAVAKTMVIEGIPYGGQDDGFIIETSEADPFRANLPA